MLAGNSLLLYPLLGFASFIAFICMSLGNLRFSFQQSGMDFVERRGTHFFSGGKAFYVNGWNSYWLMDQAVEEYSRPRVRAMFEAGAKMGLTVCRTWAFNDGAYNALQLSPGQFDERVFKALDRVILEAQRHGIRLILSLINNLPAFGGKPQYVKWAIEEGIASSSSNDSFFFDPSIRGYFKYYLKVHSASTSYNVFEKYLIHLFLLEFTHDAKSRFCKSSDFIEPLSLLASALPATSGVLAFMDS
ncbi:Mannan endo-1,4-beta-mannosidase 2 [Asimina triloba]